MVPLETIQRNLTTRTWGHQTRIFIISNWKVFRVLFGIMLWTTPMMEQHVGGKEHLQAAGCSGYSWRFGSSGLETTCLDVILRGKLIIQPEPKSPEQPARRNKMAFRAFISWRIDVCVALLASVQSDDRGCGTSSGSGNVLKLALVTLILYLNLFTAGTTRDIQT